MFEFFNQVAAYWNAFTQFFVMFMKYLSTVFIQITNGLIAIPLAVAYLPDIIKPVIMAIVAYAIIVNLFQKGG